MNDDLPHILVVDDDDRLRKLLQKYLGENGFAVSVASNASDARTKLSLIEFDLIVLDVMMPGETGLEFAEKFRLENSMPILMLTAMSEIDDRIAGLEKGADDYLTKPFEPRELLLRINNILKRAALEKPQLTTELAMGDFIFDMSRKELSQAGEMVRLTSLETALLSALGERPGEVLSREDLADLTGSSAGDRTVDVQITRLRKKLEEDPKMPRYLQTVRGQGYVLRPD